MEHLQKCGFTEPWSQDINKIEKNACQENGFQNLLSSGYCYKQRQNHIYSSCFQQE